MTLPNFVVAGAPKAGTSSLFYYLGQHPEIYTSPIKEPRYFNFDPTNSKDVQESFEKRPIRTIEDYKGLFAAVKDEPAIGEATASYFHSVLAPIQMKETIPDARLIFILRNPVERLYSLFLLQLRGKQTDLDANVYDVCRPGGELALFSRYAPHVNHWLNYFDREQMQFVLLEDLKSDPQLVFRSIFQFLQIDDQFVPDTSRVYNVGGVPKNELAKRIRQALRGKPKAIGRHRYFRKLRPYVPVDSVKYLQLWLLGVTVKEPEGIPEDLASELKSFFIEDMIELQDILGRDLSVWELTSDKTKNSSK